MRPPAQILAKCLTLFTSCISSRSPSRSLRGPQPAALHMASTRSERFGRAALAGSAVELSRKELLGIAACCVPPLEGTVKGGAGRVATIGGSLEYTGAPYFAAAAALRAGIRQLPSPTDLGFMIQWFG